MIVLDYQRKTLVWTQLIKSVFVAAAIVITPHSCQSSHGKIVLLFEPAHEKTNNLGSDQVRHKLGCTVTEDG